MELTKEIVAERIQGVLDQFKGVALTERTKAEIKAVVAQRVGELAREYALTPTLPPIHVGEDPDNPRGVVINIDPRYFGFEAWETRVRPEPKGIDGPIPDHAAARAAAQRFIDYFFATQAPRDMKSGPRTSIPAREDDDDLLLANYIAWAQQRHALYVAANRDRAREALARQTAEDAVVDMRRRYTNMHRRAQRAESLLAKANRRIDALQGTLEGVIAVEESRQRRIDDEAQRPRFERGSFEIKINDVTFNAELFDRIVEEATASSDVDMDAVTRELGGIVLDAVLRMGRGDIGDAVSFLDPNGQADACDDYPDEGPPRGFEVPWMLGRIEGVVEKKLSSYVVQSSEPPASRRSSRIGLVCGPTLTIDESDLRRFLSGVPMTTAQRDEVLSVALSAIERARKAESRNATDAQTIDALERAIVFAKYHACEALVWACDSRPDGDALRRAVDALADLYTKACERNRELGRALADAGVKRARDATERNHTMAYCDIVARERDLERAKVKMLELELEAARAAASGGNDNETKERADD